ncbi:isopeptide-forming domain-containing fimbrial protein [Schaalia sp. JY-X169]|uniref:isopeptide-forming domain-containing fimbrial protein n=1 Tax=Schaalia sp. JY-X169 TaxID=2758572 RepID=UPI0015F696E6|nr:isopeptide-forming domain-containing fimbrial protein [Schaalia sp. JY-X169]
MQTNKTKGRHSAPKKRRNQVLAALLAATALIVPTALSVPALALSAPDLAVSGEPVLTSETDLSPNEAQSGDVEELLENAVEDTPAETPAKIEQRAAAPVPLAAAINPLSCEAIYAVSKSGQIQEVALPGGAVKEVGNKPSSVSSFNGLAIGGGGTVAYGYERSSNGNNSVGTVEIYKYDPATGNWTSQGGKYSPGQGAQFVAGAVDLKTGDYYFGGYASNAFHIYRHNVTTKANSYVGYISAATVSGSNASNNGDMAFDVDGNLFIVHGNGPTVRGYTVTAASLQSAINDPGKQISRSENGSANSGMSNINGAAYGNDGKVYLGDDATIYGFTMPGWNKASAKLNNSNIDSTDLASCSTPPTLTIQKNIVDRASSADQFKLSLNNADKEVASAVTTGSANGLQTQQIGPEPVTRGQKLTFSEALVGGNITDGYTSSWVCKVGNTVVSQSGDGNSTSGSITIPQSSAATVCTFTNTPKAGSWELTKSSNPASGSTVKPGQDITYIVTAKNTSNVDVKDVVVNDDLTEVLKYAVLDSGSIVAGQGSAVVTGDQLTWNVGTLTAKTTTTLKYTVKVKDSAVGVTLKNVVTVPDTVTPPTDCAVEDPNCRETTHETGAPKIVKTGQSATKRAGPGLVYDLVYKIEVSNPTEAALDYTLTDTPPVLPAGVSQVGDWTVEAGNPAGTISQPTKGTNNPWQIATGTLTADATHTYLIKAVVEVDRTVAVGNEACEDTGKTGLALINGATIKTGSFEASDDGCVAIEMTQLNMDKSVASTTAEDDGTWTIVYDVVVSMPNTGTAEDPHYGRTTYDLSDELKFGAGITVNNASWVLTGNNPDQVSSQNPQNGSFNLGTSSAQMADDRPIGGSKDADPKNTYEHTYTVTVNASVAEGAWGSDALKCSASGTQNAGGFLNVATLDYSGGHVVDDACSTPAIPSVEKTGRSATLGADGTTWTLTYDVTVSNPSDSELPFTLTDTPDPMPTGVERLSDWVATAPEATPLDGDTFDGTGTWTLVDGARIPAGTDYTYTVSTTVKVTTAVNDSTVADCADTEVHGIVFPNLAEVTSGKHNDKDTGCVAIPVGDLDLDKTWKSSSQRVDGTWDVTYDVTVANNSEFAQTYDLTDGIKFDQSQIKVVGGQWTGRDGAATGTIASGATSVTLATSQALPAEQTDTYTVTVNASVEPGAWTADTQPTKCAAQGGPANGGFFNTAHLEWVGGSDDAEDCASPQRPGIDKQFLFAQPHADDPNVWSVGYSVFVLGSPTASFYVDVYDEPGFPTGVELVEGTWLSPYPNEGGTEVTEGTVAVDGDDAWLIERGVEVPRGGMVRYQVTWDVRIPARIPADLAECEASGAGHGFFNEARLVNGGTTQTDDACGEITPAVNPSVEKNVLSTVQNDDGTWGIEYEVVVTLPTKGLNPGGLSAKYDLTDTLDYGDGLTPVSATWQQVQPEPAGSVSDFNTGSWSAQLASGKIITTEDPQHVYKVSVVANAKSSAFEGGTDVCVAGEDGAEKSGFLNRAVLTSNSTESEADACSEPAAPSIEKVANDAVDNGDGTWSVSYLATVTNPTGGESGAEAQDLTYRLVDTPAGLPAGVSLVDGWSVASNDQVTSDAGLPTTATPPAAGDWVIAEGSIPANTTYSFLVSAKVKLDVSELGEFEDCEGGGTGIGLANGLGIVSGGFEADDEACGSIPVPDLSFSKSLVGFNQVDTDGNWRVVYDVVVTNSSENGTVYDLTDDLKFGSGITVTSASWTGPTDGAFAEGTTSAQLANGQYIAGGDYHVYTVTVNAKVAPGAWENPGALKCAAEGSGNGGGFLNEATVVWPGGTVEDNDCAQPGRPSIQKDGVHSTQSASDPSQWTVAYVITVSGEGLDSATVYDLTDTPAFATGVTINGGTAKLRGEDGSVTLPAAGGTIAEDKALAAGQTHTWDVSWTVTINSPIPPADAGCENGGTPGKGFFNTAQLSTGGTDQEDDACLPIDTLVRPSVDKTAKVATQNDDGSWTVTYDVTVALPEKGEGNPNGLSAKYDLTDTLDYGDGLTPTSATWQQVKPEPAGAVSDFDSTGWVAKLATGKTITPGATHTYEVVVVAEAGNAAFEKGTASCSATGEDERGGFLNTATMSSGGTDTDVEACTEPAAPSATKVGQDPIQNADGTFTVSYDITVRNDNDIDVVYELTDTPDAFPTGVTLVEGTTWTAAAVAPTEDARVVAPSKPAEGNWVFAAGRLAPGASDKFTVTAKIAVDPAKVESVPLPEECEAGGYGIPLGNQLGMVSGEVEVNDPGCVRVPEAPTWELEKSSVAKSGSEVKPGEIVTYTLKVTNTGEVNLFDALVEDNLTDVLKHATLVKDSLNDELALSEDGKTLTWSVPEVPTGESVTVSYKVKVNADAKNVKFKNVATPASPLGECVADKCTTNHTVPGSGGKLPVTGANVGLVLGGGLLLLGGGYIALRASKTRGRGQHLSA